MPDLISAAARIAADQKARWALFRAAKKHKVAILTGRDQGSAEMLNQTLGH